jgi:hypothetical protein
MGDAERECRDAWLEAMLLWKLAEDFAAHILVGGKIPRWVFLLTENDSKGRQWGGNYFG